MTIVFPIKSTWAQCLIERHVLRGNVKFYVYLLLGMMVYMGVYGYFVELNLDFFLLLVAIEFNMVSKIGMVEFTYCNFLTCIFKLA